MKRIRSLILAAAVIAASFPVATSSAVTVSAKTDYNLYPMSCLAYEVDLVNSQGGFTSQGCYTDYSTALQTMKQSGNDAVLRHVESYSPTKVIAMNSGVIYSYPQRDGKNTVTITQYASSVTNMKTTYVTWHREAAYFGTESYDGAGNGKVHINLTGFDGYIDLKDVDLVPMKFITDEMTLYLGGNSTFENGEDPFSTHVYQGYYSVSLNGNYRDLTYHCFSGYSKDTWPLEWKMTVGPAAEWMSTGSVYYSYNGYDFYSDRNYTNKSGTYYNYYQFQPLRTKSNVSASTFNTFLTASGYDSSSKLWDTGQIFLDAQETYGVNALMAFSMACLESAYGTSKFATERNNLFGWKAYDSDANQAASFASIEAGINEHMGLNLRGYLDINDYRYFGGQLGNKGSGMNVKYAADPYWGMKIAAIAYSIDKADNGYDGTLSDCDTASLGLINTYGVSILKSAGGSALYNSAYGATYQNNHIVSILGESGNYYKIQSTSYLASDGSVKSLTGESYLTYDWNQFTGWILKSQVDRINSTEPDTTGTVPSGDYVMTAALSWDGDKLKIAGTGYRPGIYVTDSNTITEKMVFSDELFSETSVTLDTTVTNSDTVSYAKSIDVSTLADGVYCLRFESSYSSLTDYNYSSYLKNISTDKLPADKTIGTKKIHFENDENGLLNMTVSTVTPAATPTPTPTASPTATPTASPSPTPSSPTASTYSGRIIQVLNSMDYDEDGKTLRISGDAFLSELDALAGSSAKIVILLYNEDDKTETEMNTVVSDESSSVYFPDGKDHTHVKYTATYDMSTLKKGQYLIKVRVTNGSVTKTAQLMDQMNDFYPKDKSFDGTSVRILKNSAYSYRYEVNVETNQIDFTKISKPTVRNSGFGMDSISLKNGTISIKGVSWIYMAGFAASDTPKTKLILVAEDGTAVSYSSTNQSCTLNYTSILRTSYSMDQICFNMSADLTGLDSGDYLIYWSVSTGSKGVYDVYHAINDYGLKPDAVTYQNRTYSITTNAESGYMVLHIE